MKHPRLLLAALALALPACSDSPDPSETDAPPTTAPTSLTSTSTTVDDTTTSDATTDDSTTGDDATTEAPSTSSTSATTGEDPATYCIDTSDDPVVCEPLHREWCDDFNALANAHIPATYADMLDHRCVGGQEPCSLCWELFNICSQVGTDCVDLDLTCGCLGVAHGVLP